MKLGETKHMISVLMYCAKYFVDGLIAALQFSQSVGCGYLIYNFEEKRN
jgi:hypothetical protein